MKRVCGSGHKLFHGNRQDTQMSEVGRMVTGIVRRMKVTMSRVTDRNLSPYGGLGLSVPGSCPQGTHAQYPKSIN